MLPIFKRKTYQQGMSRCSTIHAHTVRAPDRLKWAELLKAPWGQHVRPDHISVTSQDATVLLDKVQIWSSRNVCLLQDCNWRYFMQWLSLGDYICRILFDSLCLTAAFAHLWMENCTKKKVQALQRSGWKQVKKTRSWPDFSYLNAISKTTSSGETNSTCPHLTANNP